MRRFYFLFVLAFSFMSELTFSQEEDSLRYVSIAGRIQNSETGEILPGVKITNETRNNSVLSKSNGFYSIVAVTGDIIRFSFVGYEPVYMKVNQSAKAKETVMVNLDPNDIYIEEVVVGELPSLNELDEAFMALEIEEDKGRELAEKNPETFNILDEVEEPAPGGPVSFLKKHVFDKIKKKSKKPGRHKKLPKHQE